MAYRFITTEEQLAISLLYKINFDLNMIFSRLDNKYFINLLTSTQVCKLDLIREQIGSIINELRLIDDEIMRGQSQL